MGSTRFTFRMNPEAFEALDPLAAQALEGDQVPVRWGAGNQVSGALIERVEVSAGECLVTMLIDEELPGPDEMLVPCCAEGACCCPGRGPCRCSHLSRSCSPVPAAAPGQPFPDPRPGPA